VTDVDYPADVAGAGAEEVVREELLAQGGLAEGTLENYRGWAERYRLWCELHGPAAFPVDDEVAQLFAHAHHPQWRWSYAKALCPALRLAHRERGLPRPDLKGLAEYLRRLRTDEETAAPQPLVEALRAQEADRIRTALEGQVPRDPRVARIRAVLVVSAVAGLPLLEVSARRLEQPDLLWAERLQTTNFDASATEVRVHIPGGETVLVDAQRHPVEFDVLTGALAAPAPGDLPLAGPPGEARRLAAAAAGRSGLAAAVSRGRLAELSREDLRFLLAHLDEDHQRRVRNWGYALVGLFTACRHDELSHFMIENLRPTSQGYDVWVERTKNFPEGHWFAVRHAGADPLTCTHPLCPACALRRQRDLVERAHGRSAGPIFATRYAGEWRVMTRQNGRLVVQDLWDRAGLPQGKRVATRALRAGGITTYSEAGWERWRIADEVSFHQDLNVLELYVRKRDPFSDEFFLPV
jgi:hypothetical protein